MPHEDDLAVDLLESGQRELDAILDLSPGKALARGRSVGAEKHPEEGRGPLRQANFLGCRTALRLQVVPRNVKETLPRQAPEPDTERNPGLLEVAMHLASGVEIGLLQHILRAAPGRKAHIEAQAHQALDSLPVELEQRSQGVRVSGSQALEQPFFG